MNCLYSLSDFLKEEILRTKALRITGKGKVIFTDAFYNLEKF
jgi:hypothetical protein